MLLCGKELRAFGSQGQLRSAVLSMKLGEIALIENEMGETPTLLLDDVFSELDARRRNALLQSAQGVQTFLTCTDKADAAGAPVMAAHVHRIELETARPLEPDPASGFRRGSSVINTPRRPVRTSPA